MTEQPKKGGVPVWLGLLALGGIAYCSSVRTTTDETVAADEPHPATLIAQNEESIAPLAVSSIELEKSFEDNEVAAQLKYGAQPLKITGVITGIKLDSENSAAVLLESGAFLPLRITLPPAQTALAAELKKGQAVTAICNELSEMMGKPFVGDCELLP